MTIDRRFAFITDDHGNHYQVLKYGEDEEGNMVAIDWDEEATSALIELGEVSE